MAPPRLIRVSRDRPILGLADFEQAGEPQDGRNLTGPSVIRVPDWVPAIDRPAPWAAYYLYFADHVGTYLRLAYAPQVSGPWTLYRPEGWRAAHHGRGVFDLGAVENDRASLALPGGEARLDHHVASPDVHLDHDRRRFVLYAHSPANALTTDGPSDRQKTFVATSGTGLNFNAPAQGGEAGHGPRPGLLGPSYFRLFRTTYGVHAFAVGGRFWSPPPGQGPLASHPADPRFDAWRPGPNPLKDWIDANPWPGLEFSGHAVMPRHAAVQVIDHGERLEIYFTCIGDQPERLFVASIDIREPPARWKVTGTPQKILTAALGWEGGDLPIQVSERGPLFGRHHALRDPAFFVDRDGTCYLFYVGGGESGIGLCRLEPGLKQNLWCA